MEQGGAFATMRSRPKAQAGGTPSTIRPIEMIG